MTVTEARNLLATWRSDEYGYIKRRILKHAWNNGSVHADDVSQDEYASRNIIGVAFNALRSAALIQSTGEHRSSRHPAAHGRRSYVYRLTERGRSYARVLQVDREAVLSGKPVPEEIYMGEQLKLDG
jgi:predicted ArsR family transcriptional regulator